MSVVTGVPVAIGRAIRRVVRWVLHAIGWGPRAVWRGLTALGRGIRALLRAPLLAARGVRHGVVVTWRAIVALVLWTRVDDPEVRARRQAIVQAVGWAAAVVLAFIDFGTAQATYDVGQLGWGVMPFLGALAGLPVGLALSRPVLAWTISASSAFVLAVALPLRAQVVWPWPVVHGLVLLTLLFAVTAHERLTRAIGAWLVTAGLFAWGVPDNTKVGWVVGVSSVAIIGLLAGRLASTTVALGRETQASSAEKARRVVLEERARIARDLHDIVAHHMSLVVVQAETARYRVPDLTESARKELESISSSARAALAETRTLLSVLRQEDEPAAHAPQPGLDRLEDLVDSARRAGVHLRTQVDGDVGDLRPGTSLAAYRILQEALANAARHAPGATVTVEVSRGPDAVHLRVLNDPPPYRDPGDPPPGAAGHGIIGMRERAGAEGGFLSAGPTGDGGYAVSASLPLGTAPAPGGTMAAPPLAGPGGGGA